MTPATIFEIDIPLLRNLQRVQLDILLKPEADLKVERWDDMLDCFAAVGQAGGFGEVSPAFRGAEPRPVSGAPASLRYVFSAAGIQWGTWRVLANLCAAYASANALVQRIALTGQGIGDRLGPPISTFEKLQSLPYPVRPAAVGFTCDITANVHETGSLYMRIGLLRAVDDQEIEALAALLANWVEVVNGGYPDADMEADESVMDATELYALSHSTLEMRVPFFNASYDAWEAVIGMLHWHDLRTPLIESFTVSP